MSMLYIKQSYVYDLPGWEMHCHVDHCGYWRANDGDHSYGSHRLLRMYKVNGMYTCEMCLIDTMNEIADAIDEEEE